MYGPCRRIVSARDETPSAWYPRAGLSVEHVHGCVSLRLMFPASGRGDRRCGTSAGRLRIYADARGIGSGKEHIHLPVEWRSARDPLRHRRGAAPLARRGTNGALPDPDRLRRSLFQWNLGASGRRERFAAPATRRSDAAQRLPAYRAPEVARRGSSQSRASDSDDRVLTSDAVRDRYRRTSTLPIGSDAACSF